VSEERRTAVYRLYAGDDALLYVGRTISPVSRFRQHAIGKPWWPEVVHKEITWHPTRRGAVDAEAIAIRTENPRYNRMTPGVTPPVLAPGPIRPLEALTEFGTAVTAYLGQLREGGDYASFVLATECGSMMKSVEAIAADLRAEMARRAMREHNLSLAGVAELLGISKARAKQLVDHAEVLSVAEEVAP
jgi:hypothetical protein